MRTCGCAATCSCSSPLLAVQAVASAAPRTLPERSIVPRSDATPPLAVELPEKVLGEPPDEAGPTETELPEGLEEPELSDAAEPVEPLPEPDAEALEERAAAEAGPDPAKASGAATSETEREADSAAAMASQPLATSLMLDGILALTVASDARFGTVRIGASTVAVTFDMTVRNLSEQGWQVTVEGPTS